MGSEKTIEEKFEDYIKDNSMKRMYMIDYLRAGYDIAKSEDKEKIEKLKKALSFYAKPSVWGKSMPHCLDSLDAENVIKVYDELMLTYKSHTSEIAKKYWSRYERKE